MVIDDHAAHVLDEAIQQVVTLDDEYSARNGDDYQYVRAAIENLNLVWAQVGYSPDSLDQEY